MKYVYAYVRSQIGLIFSDMSPALTPEVESMLDQETIYIFSAEGLTVGGARILPAYEGRIPSVSDVVTGITPAERISKNIAQTKLALFTRRLSGDQYNIKAPMFALCVQERLDAQPIEKMENIIEEFLMWVPSAKQATFQSTMHSGLAERFADMAIAYAIKRERIRAAEQPEPASPPLSSPASASLVLVSRSAATNANSPNPTCILL